MGNLPDHLRDTRAAYDRWAQDWTDQTVPQSMDLLEQLVQHSPPGPLIDLGCGPGWHLGDLGPTAVGLDLSMSMLQIASETAPRHPLVLADLARIPAQRASCAGAWASRTLLHLTRAEVPAALAGIHDLLMPGGVVAGVVSRGDKELGPDERERFPGRTYSAWDPDDFTATPVGAGFAVQDLATPSDTDTRLHFLARRLDTLPDMVGADMKLLICGLNPSPSSVEAGVGFFRAGNRFWPAAIAADVVSRDRDPWHALTNHGVGMTDLAKRATRRADELDADEYREGLDRVAQLVARLRPQAICMVGLAGWRAVVDRSAGRGWQDEGLAGVPVYVMPSTSGLNAHDTIDTLADHLRTAAAGPPN